MNQGELLSIEPQELKFHFELKKRMSTTLQLSNKTDHYVAFKVKTTNPKKYSVRPNAGIVLPGSTSDIIVTMQAQKEMPVELQSKDKFLLQSVIAPDCCTPKDINPEMFSKEAGNNIEECKLRVFYVVPQQSSPIPEGSDEGSSPKGSASDNGNSNGFATLAKAYGESHEKAYEEKKLAAEVEKLVQENKRLRKELGQLRPESSSLSEAMRARIIYQLESEINFLNAEVKMMSVRGMHLSALLHDLKYAVEEVVDVEEENLANEPTPCRTM